MRYDRNFQVEPGARDELAVRHRRRRCASRCARTSSSTTARPFTADDVVFSFGRIMQPQGTMQIYVSGVKEVKKIDDFTVDLILAGPNPVLLRNLVDFRIMSKDLGGEEQVRERRRTTRPRKRPSPRATPTAPAPTCSSAGSRTSASSWPPTRPGGASSTATSPTSSTRRSSRTRRASRRCSSGDVDMVTDLPMQDVDAPAQGHEAEDPRRRTRCAPSSSAWTSSATS